MGRDREPPRISSSTTEAMGRLEANLPEEELDLYDDEEEHRPVVLHDICNGPPKQVRSVLTRLCYEDKYKRLEDAAGPRNKLLLRVGREPGARAVTGCLPSAFEKTKITADRFRLKLRRDLGVPIFRASTPTDPLLCCFCDELMDSWGDHAVSCSGDGLRNTKHNELRDATQGCCNSADFKSNKESLGLLGKDGWERPADLRVRNWGAGGKDAWFDVTIVNPFNLTHFDGGMRTFGFATEEAEKRKRNGAQTAAEEKGAIYIPLAFTTEGGMGVTAAKTFQILAHRAADRWGSRVAGSLLKFRAQLAKAIAVGNAKQFQAHMWRRPTLDN